MAKKKKQKQKKVGLMRRQQNKKLKKRTLKKKILAQQPVQKKISQSKVKQNLKNLPSLVFEPELEKIAFTGEEIKAALAKHDKVPDQIEAIATVEFQQIFLQQMNELKQRFERENNQNKTMMAHAVLYFMEQENAPACLNQIIVGMFYRGLNAMKSPDLTVTFKELDQMLKDYDKTWSSYLQEKVDLMQNETVAADQVKDAEALPNSEQDTDLEITESTFEALIEEFYDYLESQSDLDIETRERTREDLEVLLNDYCEEKNITNLEEIRPRKVSSFLEGWFVRTMHPTRDDVVNMISSLEMFYNFAAAQEKIPAETCRDVLEILGKKDEILSNLGW